MTEQFQEMQQEIRRLENIIDGHRHQLDLAIQENAELRLSKLVVREVQKLDGDVVMLMQIIRITESPGGVILQVKS